MAAFCDLHTHSRYSAGTSSPAELIDLAEKAGLAAVALCDHNTVEGLPEFLAAGQNSRLEAVPGIEVSTEYRGIELHILGLFLEPACFDAIQERMDGILAKKEESNIRLVEQLRKQGVDLDYWAIKAETPSGSVNRAVIASYMQRQGYCDSVKEAFDRWLAPERGLYVPPVRPDAYEMISYLKSNGAVTVLAHPFLNLKEADNLREFLAGAHGLDAMEVYYPKFNAEQTALALQIAEEFSLIGSGGSDFHGDNKPDIRIGVGRGTLAVPLKQLFSLKERK